MVVHEALELVVLDADLQRVPIAQSIMRGAYLLQDRPGINVGAVKARQSKLTRGGIETVVFVAAVGMKHEACGAGFVIQLHGNGDFKWRLRDRRLPETQGTAAKAAPPAPHREPAAALPPMSAHPCLPPSRFENADRQPFPHSP